MGLLLNPSFWIHAGNEIWSQRPMPGQPMTREQVIAVLGICCKAFTDLAHDKDLDRDLTEIAEISRLSGARREVKEFGLDSFLERFRPVEHALLVQSAMPIEQAAELLDQVRRIAQKRGIETVDPGEFKKVLEHARRLACERAMEQMKEKELEALAGTMPKAIGGATLIASDAAAVVSGIVFQLPLASATASIGFGWSLFKEGVRW